MTITERTNKKLDAITAELYCHIKKLATKHLKKHKKLKKFWMGMGDYFFIFDKNVTIKDKYGDIIDISGELAIDEQYENFWCQEIIDIIEKCELRLTGLPLTLVKDENGNILDETRRE